MADDSEVVMARVRELLARYSNPRTALEDAKGLCQEVVPDVNAATAAAGEEVFVLTMAASALLLMAAQAKFPMRDAMAMLKHVLLTAHEIGRQRRRKAIVLPGEAKH